MIYLKSGQAYWKIESNTLLLIDKFSLGLTLLKKFRENLIWDFIDFDLHKRFTQWSVLKVVLLADGSSLFSVVHGKSKLWKNKWLKWLILSLGNEL